MLLTHPKRSILLFSVGYGQKVGERDDAIAQINNFLLGIGYAEKSIR